MDSDLISALIGLGGVLVGASIAWLTTQSAERRRNAVGLYDAFSSAEMEDVRNAATQYLCSNLKSSVTLSFHEMHTDTSTKDLLSVSRLLHFWERTYRLIEVGYVDESLTRELLEHYFVSHYQTYLHAFSSVCRERRDPPAYLKWTEAILKLATRWKVQTPSESGAVAA